MADWAEGRIALPRDQPEPRNHNERVAATDFFSRIHLFCNCVLVTDVHHRRDADHLGRTVEITEKMAHRRRLRNPNPRLKPICSDNAVASLLCLPLDLPSSRPFATSRFIKEKADPKRPAFPSHKSAGLYWIDVVSSMKRPMGFWKKSVTLLRDALRKGL